MKGHIKHWAAFWVLALAGCASTPEAVSTGSVSPAESGSSGEQGSPPEVMAALPEDSDGESAALPAFYAADQAVRGDNFFRETCLSCHASSEFRGSIFERQWKGRTVRDLYAAIAFSMPDDNPGGLPAQTYVDIIAYVLELNGYPAGGTELKSDRASMRALELWPEG